MTDEEVSARLRADADERRARSLERVETLDLRATTWPGLPPSRVVNAITFAARRSLHRYAASGAPDLRAELAHRHGIEADRVVVGAGIAQLLRDATAELLAEGDELVTPWPSYGLYPLLARRV